MAEDVKVALSMKQLALMITVMITIMGAGTAALGFVFASRASVTVLELKHADTGHKKLSEWRLQTLEVKTDNMEARQQKMDVNLSSLLGRFRVAKAPEPQYLPLPVPPKE